MDDTGKDGTSRAGRYERQPTGYRAFIPAALPPNPSLRLEGELQSLLSLADRALGVDFAIDDSPARAFTRTATFSGGVSHRRHCA